MNFLMMSDDNIHHHLSSLSSLHNKIVENVFVRLCWFCQNLHQFSTCDIVDEKRCYDIIILYCIVLCVILLLWTKKIIPCPLLCRVSTIWGFVAIGLCRKILQQSDSTDFSPTIWMYHSPPHQAPLWMQCYIEWIFKKLSCLGSLSLSRVVI